MRVISILTGTVFMVLVLAMVSAGCGEDTNTPAGVIREHVRLLNERKFDEFYELHAEGVLPPTEDVYLKQIEQLFPQGAQITDVKIIKEEVEGDKAMVTWSSRYKYPGQEEKTAEVTTTLVRENGRWKIGEDTSPVP